MRPSTDTADSKFRLLFGSVISLNWLMGLVLASCLFLPLARGCDNREIYPRDLAINNFDQAANFVELIYVSVPAFWMARPYLYGLLLAILTISAVFISGVRGRTLLNRGLLGWSTLAVVMLFLHGTALLADALNEAPPRRSELFTTSLLFSAIVLPPTALWIAQIWLTRAGRHWVAITTGQIGWAILCGLRFGLWLDPRELLIGGKISLAVCLVLVESARLQHHYARSIFEVDAVPRKLQFGTRYLLALTFAAALFLAWVLAPLPAVAE